MSEKSQLLGWLASRKRSRQELESAFDGIQESVFRTIMDNLSEDLQAGADQAQSEINFAKQEAFLRLASDSIRQLSVPLADLPMGADNWTRLVHQAHIRNGSWARAAKNGLGCRAEFGQTLLLMKADRAHKADYLAELPRLGLTEIEAKKYMLFAKRVGQYPRFLST